jgi:hypothetical protein
LQVIQCNNALVRSLHHEETRKHFVNKTSNSRLANVVANKVAIIKIQARLRDALPRLPSISIGDEQTDQAKLYHV